MAVIAFFVVTALLVVATIVGARELQRRRKTERSAPVVADQLLMTVQEHCPQHAAA